MNNQDHVAKLENHWATDKRWQGIRRGYSAEAVVRLRGSVEIKYTLGEMGANRLWELLHSEHYVAALGAMTGCQAVQQVQAGLKAIYLSGWQVAADANLAGQMYPDQSLYPANSVPDVVRKINQSLQRADQISQAEGRNGVYWFAPIVADAEAGFGGNLNAFELMKAMIEAGAAAVHFEDQLASAKKCGHMGGKVLVPTEEFIQKLVAARLAADVMGVPTILIARTDANGASLLTSDVDERDHPFLTGGRTSEGFFAVNAGLEQAIARGLAYAPYADMIWCETSEPNLEEAGRFAHAIHAQYPGKLLAYNCSPSFNWKKKLDEHTIAKFQKELALMGYKFQFITLAGFHALNLGMFELAQAYRETGMTAYARLQETEFDREADSGYRGAKH
ncbi:MAG: isocitrate lyase, partial [Acidobacteriales bacterium]|nr:isocitrate lyase [Terriglobales bacterium]